MFALSLTAGAQNIATTSSGTILTNDVGATIHGTPYQTKRVSYTVTGMDTSATFSTVAVTFTTAFADTNYTVVFSIDNYKALTQDYMLVEGPIISKTASGFSAIVFMPIGIKRYAGQKITINAIAIHD